MTVSGKAASVHDRLLTQARASSSDFNLILTRYSLERFLYRLSISPYKDNFLLKGALLFALWYKTPHRPTRDADLLGLESETAEGMAAIFREICGIYCDDGMEYLVDSVHATEIRDNARYGGIRVDLLGRLGNARCKLQIDVGYGDVVTPGPEVVSYPCLLTDNPTPQLKAYPKETVIAEKLEAIVSLGMANSRMKDYFDLFVLLREGTLELKLVSNAVERTFERRMTIMPHEVPFGLSVEFGTDKGKNAQWKAFLSKNGLSAPQLDQVVEVIWEKVRIIIAR
jgi:hypothetical protein